MPPVRRFREAWAEAEEPPVRQVDKGLPKPTRRQKYIPGRTQQPSILGPLFEKTKAGISGIKAWAQDRIRSSGPYIETSDESSSEDGVGSDDSMDSDGDDSAHDVHDVDIVVKAELEESNAVKEEEGDVDVIAVENDAAKVEGVHEGSEQKEESADDGDAVDDVVDDACDDDENLENVGGELVGDFDGGVGEFGSVERGLGFGYDQHSNDGDCSDASGYDASNEEEYYYPNTSESEGSEDDGEQSSEGEVSEPDWDGEMDDNMSDGLVYNPEESLNDDYDMDNIREDDEIDIDIDEATTDEEHEIEEVESPEPIRNPDIVEPEGGNLDDRNGDADHLEQNEDADVDHEPEDRPAGGSQNCNDDMRKKLVAEIKEWLNYLMEPYIERNEEYEWHVPACCTVGFTEWKTPSFGLLPKHIHKWPLIRLETWRANLSREKIYLLGRQVQARNEGVDRAPEPSNREAWEAARVAPRVTMNACRAGATTNSETELAALRAQLERYKERAEGAESAYSSLYKDYDLLLEDRSQLKHDIAELEEGNEALRAAKIRIRDGFRIANANLKETNRRVRVTKKLYFESRRAVDELISEQERLRRQQERTQAREERTRKKNHRLNLKMKALKREIERTQDSQEVYSPAERAVEQNDGLQQERQPNSPSDRSREVADLEDSEFVSGNNEGKHSSPQQSPRILGSAAAPIIIDSPARKRSREEFEDDGDSAIVVNPLAAKRRRSAEIPQSQHLESQSPNDLQMTAPQAAEEILNGPPNPPTQQSRTSTRRAASPSARALRERNRRRNVPPRSEALSQNLLIDEEQI